MEGAEMETATETRMEWRDALDEDDLWEGDMTGVEVGGVKVLLVNTDGEVKAYENRCSHQEWPLDDGDFDGETITCSRHSWEFDSLTGQGVNPSDCALTCFAARIRDGRIEVQLP